MGPSFSVAELGESIGAGAVRAGVGAARSGAPYQVALAHGRRARLTQRQDTIAVHGQCAATAAAGKHAHIARNPLAYFRRTLF